MVDTALSGTTAMTLDQQIQQTVDHVVTEVRIDSGVRPSGKGSDVSSDHSSLVSQTEATEQSKFDGVQSQQDRTLIDEGVCSNGIASDSKKQQKDATEAGLFILRKNQTWSLVIKPPIPKLIQTKWFKPEGDNKPRYKARLVAKVLPAYKLKYRSDELKVNSE